MGQQRHNMMFRRGRIGRNGGEVILYIKKSIHDFEIKIERETDCD